MAETARLRLPEIAAAQAQKHITHNEALVALDSLVQISVVDKDLTAPPGSPTEGDCYIVASGATGDWTGWDDRIARYEDGEWRSFLPGAGDGEGWLAYVQDEAVFYVLNGAGAWVTLASILSLGTAAYEDIGTSGSNVPRLSGANTWSAAQTISTSSLIPLQIVTSDNGSGNAPRVFLERYSASPADGDLIGNVRYYGYNSAAELIAYAQQFGRIGVVTDGSETGEMVFRGVVAGGSTATDLMVVGDGVYLAGATGAGQGVGTLNATTLYDDGVAVCPALRSEFLESGTVDTDFWDATVPDLVIPEHVEEIEVLEDVEEDVVAHRRAPDGTLTRTMKQRVVQRPKMELVPVYDDAGNGLYAIEQPVMETRVTPGQTVPRRHHVAHLFKAMVDEGFDPRDPAQYIARLKADQALPGMLTLAEQTAQKRSLTERFERLNLAADFLALVVVNHEERIAALEGR